MLLGIVNDLFKPQLPSSQIVKMGIDVNDIGEVPILAQTKRQSSTTGNGQVPTDAQSNDKQSSTNKKEGKQFLLELAKFQADYLKVQKFSNAR